MASSAICINDALTDDELRAILARLDSDRDKEVFGFVCKKWLNLQSTERRKLSARAGPHMLRRVTARFTRVMELDLSQSMSRSFYPGFTDSDVALIADALKYLRVFNLQNCKAITDNGMASIGKGLPSLQSLDVSYCRKLTDEGFLAVAKGCRNLKTLHLAGCKLVSNVLLQALSTSCHNLEELGLQGCSNITDFGLTDLVKGCRRISYLDINKCSNIGDVGISNLSEACSYSLKTLKLLDCFNVGDESIFSLARFCKNLETLIIGGCRGVSDESIKSLASSCKKSLRNLRMDWCCNISDASLRCIFVECRNLEAIDIGCCEEVTDACFQDLGSKNIELPLKVLKVSNCPKITVSGMSILVERCRSLEYLDVRSCPHITEAECKEAGLMFPECCKVNFTGSLTEPDVLI